MILWGAFGESVKGLAETEMDAVESTLYAASHNTDLRHASFLLPPSSFLLPTLLSPPLLPPFFPPASSEASNARAALALSETLCATAQRDLAVAQRTAVAAAQLASARVDGQEEAQMECRSMRGEMGGVRGDLEVAQQRVVTVVEESARVGQRMTQR